jgi:hypothetical protein
MKPEPQGFFLRLTLTHSLNQWTLKLNKTVGRTSQLSFSKTILVMFTFKITHLRDM